MAALRKACYLGFCPREDRRMDAGLTRLSDDELTRLRERAMQLIGVANPEQRALAAIRLEAIDLERERRLAVPIG
jgi:hypothetical protein